MSNKFDEERTFRAIEAMRADGKNWPQVARILNEKGIKTKNGDDWTHTYVPIFCKRMEKKWGKNGEQAASIEPEPVTKHGEDVAKEGQALVTEDIPRNGEDVTKTQAPSVTNHGESVTKQGNADIQPLPEATKTLLSEEQMEAVNELVTLYQTGTIPAMVEWWKNRDETKTPVATTPTQENEQRPVFHGRRRNTGLHIHNEILTMAMEKVKRDKLRTGGSLSLLVELLLWRYVGSPGSVLEGIPADDKEPTTEDQ